MCTRFRLYTNDLFSQEPAKVTTVTLTEVLAVPGHWSFENYVPPDLLKWAVRHHEKGDSFSCSPRDPRNDAHASFRYTLVQL